MEALVIAGMMVCVAAAVLARQRAGNPERKRARRILAATPALAADSPDGAVVAVTGVVRKLGDGERFIAPLSEARCVAYRTWVSARRGRFAYASVHDELHVRAFLLERTDAAPIVVDSTHAVFDVAPEKLGFGFTRQVQLLRALGLHDANAAASEFEELVVEVGALVTVAGTLERTIDSAPGTAGREQLYREGVRPTLRLVGDRAHPIAIGSRR